MKILIDSGNSRLHFGKWYDSHVIDTLSVTYPETIHDLTHIVRDYCTESQIEAIAFCSVSSKWSLPLVKLIQQMYQGKALIVHSTKNVGITIRYSNPESMGIDRILAGYAVKRMKKVPCVVASFGTAITIDAISSVGEMLGGYIFPGYSTMAKSLSNYTGLPDVPVTHTDNVVGNTTEECIQRGISGTIHAGVESLVAQALRTADGNHVIATGGDAEFAVINKWFSVPIEYRPSLVLEGLGFYLDEHMNDIT